MPRLIAIDLGAHTVKATVWSGTSRRKAFDERVAQPVPQDLGATPTLAARMAALQELLAARKDWVRGGATLALAWPGDMTTVHRMILPFIERAQVEKTLPFAVEAEVPFDLETMVMGSRLVVRETDTEALVAFTKKEAMAGAIEALAAVGLDPRHVFVETDVVARFAPPGRIVAIVDVGHVHTLISIVRGGQTVIGRSINVAGRDFTVGIATALAVPFAEAEAIKHGERADLPVEDERVRAALDAPIGLLLAEVRSTLISAEDALGVEIDEVRLTGGGARLASIHGYFSHDLGVPVDWLSDTDGAAVPLGWAVPDAVAEILSGQGRGNDIDLRSGDLAWRGGFDVSKVLFLYGAPLLAFLCVTFIVVSALQWRSLNNELADVDQRVKDTVTKTLPDVDPTVVRDGTTAKAILSEKAKEVMARAEILDRTDPTPPTVDKLKALTEAFPAPDQVRVEVTELTITPDNITFNAQTDGYASSSAVEESIKKAPRFKDAAKGNEKKVRETVTFTVTIPLQGGAAATSGEPG